MDIDGHDKIKSSSGDDWIPDAERQTGTNIRISDDTKLAAKLKRNGFAEILQAPQRARAPATGRPKYILKIYLGGDAPVVPIAHRSPKTQACTEKGGSGIPWFLLASLAEAAMDEYRRQRSSISAQLDREVESLEAQLHSTHDRTEKKRLADALQTALQADENLDAQIGNRVYAKLANSDKSYSRYIVHINWQATSNDRGSRREG